MLRHERKHTGEKPFSCLYDGCTRTFSRFDNLMPHFRNHSGFGRSQEVDRAEDEIELLRTHSVDELKKMSREKRVRIVDRGSHSPSADSLLRSPSAYSTSTGSPSTYDEEADAMDDEGSLSFDEDDEAAVQGLRSLQPNGHASGSVSPSPSPSPSIQKSASPFYFPPHVNILSAAAASLPKVQLSQHQTSTTTTTTTQRHQTPPLASPTILTTKQQFGPLPGAVNLPGVFSPSFFASSSNEFDRHLLSRFRGPL